MRDMTWMVFVEDINRRTIRQYNVFDHVGFSRDVKEIYRRHKHDREAFNKELWKSVHYFFWSKCEWEIVLTSWPEREGFVDKKIDVADQIETNWTPFSEYVWTMAHLRKRSKSKA